MIVSLHPSDLRRNRFIQTFGLAGYGAVMGEQVWSRRAKRSGSPAPSIVATSSAVVVALAAATGIEH